jgi:CubicO group peptidase (beta-lactamase class C family)
MRSSSAARIGGRVMSGFEPLRDAFIENFSRRRELGGACCVYHRGERVVDLWGGVRNAATSEPWEEDTMVLVYSATKGLAAMTLAIAHSRGWLDYDERVAVYWPEFAQQAKEAITVRQLLAHQAGLFAFEEQGDRRVVADLDRLAVVLARQKPAWEPGTRQGYHAITLGYYESELLRRIDPRHRSLGQFFQDEIATPLELDFYIRLPEWIPNSRFATLARPSPLAMLFGFPIRLTLAVLNPRANIVRALAGSMLPHDEQRIYARNLEVPSGGGVGTARAIARAYSAFANDGKELGLRAETLRALAAPAVVPARGSYDECMMGDGVEFSLGFMKHCRVWPFGSAGSFGAPGTGGALGFADPEAHVGYAYVTSGMGTSVTGDPRDVALRNALYSVLSAKVPVRGGNSMELQTRRLKVVLQTRQEVERMIEAMPEHARSQLSAEWLARMRASKEPDPWANAFRVVRLDTDAVVGTCSFKGPPVEGVVEIAYGTNPEDEGNGYATEAARALVDFAASRPDVRLVRAQTLPGARASQRVLAKCGFRYVGEAIDPEDGLVSRFELGCSKPSEVGSKPVW